MKTAINQFTVSAFALVALWISGCSKDDYNYGGPVAPVINANVFSAAGDSAAIVAKLEAFRQVSGNVVNNAPGAIGGRREVNWDGVPANLTNNNNFPFDFFGSADAALPNGRKRGLVMTNTGTSFRVDSTDFASIDPSYAAQFEAFSRKRLFTYLGNNITEVTFNVPGTNTAAFVNGFAAIFSDVDDANSTSMEFFAGNKSLGVFKAANNAQGFSLLGVNFPGEKITRVKITAGNGLLAPGVKDTSDGGTFDLVVMDDFIYDEPKQIN